VFTEATCCKDFKASGLVPLDAQVVLIALKYGCVPTETSKLRNTHEFGSQSNLIRESFTRSPVTASSSVSQLVKGAEHMLHQAVLLAARNTELEEQSAVMTKRKTRNLNASGSSMVVLWIMVRQQPRWPQRPL
jgi:hypothetical protein